MAHPYNGPPAQWFEVVPKGWFLEIKPEVLGGDILIQRAMYHVSHSISRK
jgi:hypothetical protein